MTPNEMEALIDAHLRAEGSGDADGAVADYTDDVEHDVVGSPTGPLHGVPAAREFYQQLVKDLQVEGEERHHTYYAGDACILESRLTGTVTGQLLGIPGNGRRITFRMLHVFEFRSGKISRENVWLDGASVAAQLTAPA